MINNSKLTEEEYFFYGWLILDKGMTREKMEALTNEELEQLKKEFKVFESNLRPKPLRAALDHALLNRDEFSIKCPMCNYKVRMDRIYIGAEYECPECKHHFILGGKIEG